MYLHQDAEGVQQIFRYDSAAVAWWIIPLSAYLSGKRTEVEHMSPEG